MLDPDRCATGGCGRPAAMTYLGRPRCQECYELEVSDEDTNMTTTNGNAKRATKTTKPAERSKSTKQPKSAKPAKAANGKPARQPATDGKSKRVSALDAAAEVLRKSGTPMRAQELITAMAEQGLWTSPNGKTPHATLYAAMLREINDKGQDARFRKVERGQFAYAG